MFALLSLLLLLLLLILTENLLGTRARTWGWEDEFNLVPDVKEFITYYKRHSKAFV